jgi:hypothetical protein
VSYLFQADGMASAHRGSFGEDERFLALYDNLTEEYGQDVRWRMWILYRLARHAARLGGGFAEFGVYRGGFARIALGATEELGAPRMHLFDTFSGIPADGLTDRERDAGFAGRLADTSLPFVEERLARWRDRTVLVPGNLFATLGGVETGPLAFVSMDLNAAAPTTLALPYAYERLVRGGVILFDDYGWIGYEDQREVVDAFLAQRPEEPLELPSGQALLFRA